MARVAPEEFISTKEFARRHSRPVAFILPTTAGVRNAIYGGTRTKGLDSVGNPAFGALYSPVEALNTLRQSSERPAIAVFSDQIVDQANTPILVKSEYGEHYISPIELILNSTYGYNLVCWISDGFLSCPAGVATLESTARMVVSHLNAAVSLGGDWEMAGFQQFRSAEARRYNAHRKLRFFRSSVMSTFMHASASPEARKLLEQADHMEKMIEDWSAAP